MMGCYIGTKIVRAEPMTSAQFAYEHRRQMIDGEGYKVVYEDGYASWSPKETFERAYRHVTPAEAALVGGA
mgnify:CR=1 FL=1